MNNKLTVVVIIGMIVFLLTIAFLTISSQLSDPDPAPSVGTTFPPQGQQGGTIVPDPTVPTLESILPPAAQTSSFAPALALMWPDAYEIYDCEFPEEGKSLRMTGFYTPNEQGFNTEEEIVRLVREAEPDLLQVVGPIVFPAGEVDVSQATQLAFNNIPGSPYGDRTAAVSYQGEEFALYYGWLSNIVMFTSSRKCLDQIFDAIYSPDTH